MKSLKKKKKKKKNLQVTTPLVLVLYTSLFTVKLVQGVGDCDWI